MLKMSITGARTITFHISRRTGAGNTLTYSILIAPYREFLYLRHKERLESIFQKMSRWQKQIEPFNKLFS
jgi:hypothetical protein